MISVGGRARGPDLAAETSYVTALAAAGADWRLEHVESTSTLGEARAVIAGGPIRADPGAAAPG